MIDGISQLDTFLRQHDAFLQAYDQLIRAVAHLPTNAESHDHAYVVQEEKRRRTIDEIVAASATEALAHIQTAHLRAATAA